MYNCMLSHPTYSLTSVRSHLVAALAIWSISFTAVHAQQTSGYGYLELPVSARVWALGGNNISIVEPEITLAEQNPALLCPEMAGQVALSYARLYGDTNLGYAAYAGHFLEAGAWSVGMRYIDYGHFEGYDEFGIPTGDFGVKDMSLQAAVGYPINDKLRIGAQVKVLYTGYESYSAFAMGVDVGLNYYDEATGNSFSLTAANLGGQFKPLYEERKERVPTQLSAGWTRELSHLPFCVSVTGYRLLDWERSFRDASGQVRKYSNADLVLNHLIFGVEWSASEHFWLAASYNYRNQRRFVHQGGFLRGVGLGAGLNFGQLAFQVAYASMHAGDGTLALQFDYHF